MIRALTDILTSVGGTTLAMAFVMPYLIHGEAICDWVVEKVDAWLNSRFPAKPDQISLDKCKARLVEEFKSNRQGEATDA